MLNLPNLITIMRIILVPVFLLVFWSADSHAILWGMVIVALAGATDIADGYLARKFNLITPLGQVLDPAADKLMIVSVAVSLFLVGKFPFWLLVLVLVKEIILILGSSFLVLKEKLEISANNLGKAATVTIYSAIFFSAFGIQGKTLIAFVAGLVSLLALTNYLLTYLRQRII